MTLKNLFPTTIIAGIALIAIWIIYNGLFPRRLYTPGQAYASIQIVAEVPPLFYNGGMDGQSFYVIQSREYPNEFRIADEVLALVLNNDTVSAAVKNIQDGDTLVVCMNPSSARKLNNTTNRIKIFGLMKEGNWIINPGNLEHYYRERKINNRFSFFVIVLILFFIYRKMIKSNKLLQ